MAGLPALAVIGASAFSLESTLSYAGAALGALGLVVCGIVRDRGRKIERKLWTNWGGNPAAQRLRWRGAPDRRRVGRIHERLNRLLGQRLPDAAAEAADPSTAERAYERAIEDLRSWTQDSEEFRLVFAENVQYGFRRNLLGIRPFALTIAGLALTVSLAGISRQGWTDSAGWAQWGPAAGIAAAVLVFSWRVVTDRWVRSAAELYADRLVQALAKIQPKVGG